MYIVGGRIKTMAGSDIPKGVLHIVNGKIAEIGRKGQVQINPGKKRLFPKRKTLNRILKFRCVMVKSCYNRINMCKSQKWEEGF